MALTKRQTFSWNANPEVNVAGYRIYAGTATGRYDDTNSPKDMGNVTAGYYDLFKHGTFFFALTAYDTGGLESSFSSEVSITVGPEPNPVKRRRLIFFNARLG